MVGGEHDYNRLEQAGVSLWDMSQTSQRWDVFRIGAESHNTLVFNGQRHIVNGKAEIIDTYNTSRSKGAVVKLTPVFAPYAREVVRTAELDKNDHLTIKDHIEEGQKDGVSDHHHYDQYIYDVYAVQDADDVRASFESYVREHVKYDAGDKEQYVMS